MSSKWLLIPTLVAVLAVASMLSDILKRRDAALNIAWPRAPIPDHGRIVTIQHAPEDIERFVLQESDRSSLKFVTFKADVYVCWLVPLFRTSPQLQ